MADQGSTSQDKKSGLDPIFGLPVTRDSRAMDIARSRNFRSDKQLETSLKTIDHNMHSKIIRCQNLVTKTRDFLSSINPQPNKRVVCPLGLSSEQKQAIRLLRRGSVPSMTLPEFDKKLSSAKACRQVNTASGCSGTDHMDKNQFSEFKMKRKVFSRNSRRFSHSMSVPNIDLGVMDNVQAMNNPLYRCKTVMDDAYQRLNSADVSHTHTKESSVRLLTITELEKDGKQRKGSASSVPDRSYNLPRGRGLVGKRRGILSETTSSRDTISPSSDSSIPTEEERFGRFLTILKGETKLPGIQT